MENLKIKTSIGIEVELNDIDMMHICKYYEVQCTADYLRDNYDWDEDKIQTIAEEVRELMADYGYCEEEAIDEAIESYEENEEDDD